jgi:hypothetical protein
MGEAIRVFWPGALLLALPGCSAIEAEEVKRCEAQLLAKLKAPSSYKRVSARSTDINPADPTNLKNLTERWVTIEYDAVNSYNAPLRDSEICKYPLRGGQVDADNMIDDSAAMSGLDNMMTDPAEFMPATPAPTPSSTPSSRAMSDEMEEAPGSSDVLEHDAPSRNGSDE